jgi:hypothetical protein
MHPSATLDRYTRCSGSSFWTLCARSGRIGRSTKILCTTPYMDFREFYFLDFREFYFYALR